MTTTPLQQAAQAVIARWDSTSWKNTRHTGEYIAELRKAIADEQAAEPEAIGEVVACNDNGHPWKRVRGYEWSLAELPVGAKVYSSPRPQATTPAVAMTREEIIDEFCKTLNCRQYVSAFKAGVKCAEIHHGITAQGEKP